MEAFTLLPDPQTNGGLLFSVKEKTKDEVISLLKKAGLEKFIEPIGKFISKGEKDDRSKKIAMQIQDKPQIISALNENS